MSVQFTRRWKKVLARQADLTFDSPHYMIFSRRLADQNMTKAHIMGSTGCAVTPHKVQLFNGKSLGPIGPVDDAGLRLLIAGHGLLLLVAWIVLVRIGRFTAHYLKPMGHSWYLAHRGLMTSVLVLSCVGVLASFLYVSWKAGKEVCFYLILFFACHAILPNNTWFRLVCITV